ncbi:MAG: hypothetical protein PVG14_14710 [Anaerolineales bacterium]|jgi:hypothetical protein
MTNKLRRHKRDLGVRGVKVLVSFIVGGLFYLIWLAIYLLSTPVEGYEEIILWLLAPVITSFGFTAGIYLFERISQGERYKFWSLYKWPLMGCLLGAGIVYWFGPMLIVFSMLILGGISVGLREFVQE